jgi:hypothetical protein
MSEMGLYSIEYRVLRSLSVLSTEVSLSVGKNLGLSTKLDSSLSEY